MITVGFDMGEKTARPTQPTGFVKLGDSRAKITRERFGDSI